MTNNVDLTINLDDDTEEKLIEIYIRTTMRSASWEVYEREKTEHGCVVAAGKALLNDSIVDAIEIGMEIDKRIKDETNDT